MAERVNEEEIMKARDIDLLDYLEKKGETFVKQGKYYRHTEHDSLIIRENMYAWNSRGEKGYGALNFIQMYYGMDFVSAVKELNKEEYQLFDKSRKAPEVKQEPFSYEKQRKLEVNHQTDIKKYLVDDRKIDPKIVNWLIGKDLIAQDKRKNVVFKWKKEGKVVGFDLQGTLPMKNSRGSFKYVAPNDAKNRNYGFNFDIGKPNKIIYFESSIDMLSYWSIQKEKVKDARLISGNGLKIKTIAEAYKQATKEGHKIKEIGLGVDNDDGGNKFKDQVCQLLNSDMIKSYMPKTKGMDWNDELKASIHRATQEKENSLLSNVREDYLNTTNAGKKKKKTKDQELGQAL
ncbi:DUF3991 domain-containing protein [Bacillus amyloliquefaciens]|uniref:DUF3991 domain-containing protein n=1 Tax=Bacillus amyloliquefaciens TaxID=1390 RepID=UPI003A85C94A